MSRQYIDWLGSDSAFAKAQMSEPRSGILCVVVERPDRHWGDDLVTCTNMRLVFPLFLFFVSVKKLLRQNAKMQFFV